MRVMCIDADAWPKDLPEIPCDDLKNGEIYIVTDVFFDEGYIWYVIQGFDDDYGYWENCFIRCDNKKTELVNHKEEYI